MLTITLKGTEEDHRLPSMLCVRDFSRLKEKLSCAGRMGQVRR